jgi:hypothetical protein
MKFHITFKDPDVMYLAVEEHLRSLELEEESDEWYAAKTKVEAVLEKFIEYREYIRVEIDVEKQTAKVLEV